MDRTSSTGFFKQNRGLELGMMILGLVLFIALSVHGLRRIGDMRVAAGERNRLRAVQAGSELQAAQLPGNPILLSSVSPQPAEGSGNTTSKNTRSTSEDRSRPQESNPQSEAKENQVEAMVKSVKRQDI
jgi:hypothetical protein